MRRASANCELLLLGYASYAAVVSHAGIAATLILLSISLSAAATPVVAWGTLDGEYQTLPVVGCIAPYK